MDEEVGTFVEVSLGAARCGVELGIGVRDELEVSAEAACAAAGYFIIDDKEFLLGKDEVTAVGEVIVALVFYDDGIGIFR